jgi:hypothetical protein
LLLARQLFARTHEKLPTFQKHMRLDGLTHLMPTKLSSSCYHNTKPTRNVIEIRLLWLTSSAWLIAMAAAATAAAKKPNAKTRDA